MSLVHQIHQDHKARQLRLGSIPKRQIIAVRGPDTAAMAAQYEARIATLNARIDALEKEKAELAARLDNRPTLPTTANEALTQHPTLTIIFDSVCKYFEISKTELLSQRRQTVVSYPRQIAMYLAKQMTLRSLPQIGHQLGGRDHTTILHGIRRIEALKATDGDVQRDIDAVAALVEAAR